MSLGMNNAKAIEMARRIDKAFKALESDGRYIARSRFLCCQTCALSAIADEIRTSDNRESLVGFAYYHEQDADGMEGGAGCHIGFGAADEEADDRAGIPVGREICVALRAAGLNVSWGGSPNKRILVDIKEWN